jgi:serine/threonine protein kinase
MDPEQPATQIGKYEILGELGRGGMGVVYRGKDKYIGREVAIKTLTNATPELRQRFLDEARSGVLNHPNIVTVYEFGEQDGNPYIVMELLSGRSLESMLKDGKPLPLVEILEIVREVCEGLGYAHSKGVVHRDIKPANVMVAPGEPTKIVDFGIARLGAASGHTVTGNVIGTVHYISPERLRGQPSDGRADIWASGVMLYLMLAGQLPFPGEDVSAMHKVVNEAYEPLSKFLSEYPPAIDAVLARALAKNPDERYLSAEDMAGDIESINEELKRSRVGEVLIQVKALLEEEQLTRVRPMLIDLQRLAPGNTEVKRLVREVQDRLSRQQRSEQIRQFTQQGDDLEREKRYAEAMESYRQASRLDPSNQGLLEKIEALRAVKEKNDKVEALRIQVRDAEQRNDLTAAAKLIGEALAVDPGHTDLRNEQVRILRDQERQAKEGTRRKLKEAGRGELQGRQFTQAIKTLRDALELDPTDSETQSMYQEAVSKQEDDRRRKIIDQIVAEIQDQIFKGQLEKALELINRALEKLPGEAMLFRLKAETQEKYKEAQTKKLVEETSLSVQNLFFSDPQQALAIVQKALETMPDEERLLTLQQRVVDQLKKVNLEGLRAQYLKQAQTAADSKNYSEAIQVLETALLDCGQSPDLQSMLDYVRSERTAAERKQASTTAIREAQELIGAGDLEQAISYLERASKETGDSSVDQLLRQTRERFEEVGRRVEAVITRISQLAETDPPQALQLLQSQPQAIQQHPQMRSLRAKLDTASEQERVTREAIARSTELLQKGQLREGIEPLEAVKQAYGSFPQIDNAIAAYKAKRTPLATATLKTAMAETRQLLLAQQAAQGLEVLRKSTPAVEFADPTLQADWKRLADEVTKAAGVKRGSTDTLPIVVQGSKASPKMIISIAVALVVVIIAAVFILKPKSTVPTTHMQLNASPYAEVVSITSSDGAAIKLPEGDHNTPMRLEAVPQGSYQVVFRGPAGASQTAACTIGDENHLCSIELQPLTDTDIEAIVAGGKQ